jgi:hypothetical protein
VGQLCVGEPEPLGPPPRAGVIAAIPAAASAARSSEIIDIWSRNHGSILGRLVHDVDRDTPMRSSSPTCWIRSGVGIAACASSSSSDSRRELLAGGIATESETTLLERPQRLLEALGERAPDRHHLADRLHLGAEDPGGAGQLLERPARDLGDHVVDHRLEARRRRHRRGLGDVVGDLVEGVADREPCGDLRDREPVAFDASADERDTRGFISITTWRPVLGSTANCTFEPPVSTPTRRMHASAELRICWYSTSVSVWIGATVIESPVCTPIGSTFSMPQMITQLSAWSRITSSSYSFQPYTDSSIRISLIGLAVRPFDAMRSNSSGV